MGRQPRFQVGQPGFQARDLLSQMSLRFSSHLSSSFTRPGAGVGEGDDHHGLTLTGSVVKGFS